MARATAGSSAPVRRRRGQEDTGGTWLTTYADAITLLMAFFVLLYAMSSVDLEKFQAFVQGLAVPFGNQNSEGLLPDSDGLQPEQPSLTEPREVIVEDVVIQELAAQKELQREAMDDLARALDAALRDAGLHQYVEQRREERGLVVSIASDDVLFATGSTHISTLGRRVIAVVARTLTGYPNDLQVEGHTDDVPLDRRGYTNWNLSTDRAVAVLNEMISRHGLPPTQAGAVGYGEFRPLADNRGRTGRARNRRVDIVVLHEEIRP